MTEAKKMAALFEPEAATEASSDFKARQAPAPWKEKKWVRILRVFFNDGASLNRFDSERYGDHCLHSTVSSLRNDYGILFDDQFEEVPALGGTAVARVKRYWLHRSEENLLRVRNLLGAPGLTSMTTV